MLETIGIYAVLLLVLNVVAFFGHLMWDFNVSLKGKLWALLVLNVIFIAIFIWTEVSG